MKKSNEKTAVNPLSRLKSIQQRVIWGSRPSSKLYGTNLVTLNDNEFVTFSGSNLLIFENGTAFSRKARIVETKELSILNPRVICVSKDGKFLAIVVKTKSESDPTEINILIYHSGNHFQDTAKCRPIKFNAGPLLRPGETVDVSAIAFSHDSMYLACSTNIPSAGILIFEQYKGTVFQTVATDSTVVSLSFHPTDANKLLGTGEANLVKFWKFTSKSVHIAAVTGLKKGNTTYTAHGWITPYAENTIVVGTNTGMVATIQNCEQRVQGAQAFSSLTAGSTTIGVSQIMVRGDHVIVSSTKNLIVLFELRRTVVQKYLGLTAVVVPLKYYQLTDMSRICGIQFCFKDSITAYSLMAVSEDSACLLDMITDQDLNSSVKTNAETEDEYPVIDWKEVKASKTLFSFHSGGIQSLSLATRSKLFVTSSFLDSTVRCWTYDDPTTYNCSWLIEPFHDRIDEIPFYVDAHPSGLQVAFACETEVREYAIADNSLDLIRKFQVRNSFQSVAGIPVVITQSVSMVKYSQGGHLMAVVTGKVAQVFHLHTYEDETNPSSGPFRLMALCDHGNPITDIVFFNDDKGIITTSSDGSVYSFAIGASTRSREFVHKGLSATHVAVTRSRKTRTTIIVSFESAIADTGPLPADIMKKRRLSSFAATRKISSSESTDVRGSRGGNDLAAIASAFVRDFERIGTPESAQQQRQSAPRSFLAVWQDDISPTPTIINTEVPVRSVAIGRVGFPDPYDLCALGLADGRILISLLPIPFYEIAAVVPQSPLPLSPTASSHSHHPMKLNSGMKKRRGMMSGSNNEFGYSDTQPDLLTQPTSRSRANFGQSESMLHLFDSSSNIPASAGGANTNLNSANSHNVNATSSHLSLSNPNEEGSNTFDAPPSLSEIQRNLDEANCKVIRIAVGSINHVAFSPDGNQIITGAEDGSVHLLTTTRNFNDLSKDNDVASTLEKQPSASTAVTTSNNNNGQNNETAGTAHFYMVEKTKMIHLRNRLIDLETFIEHNKRDHELQINKVIENKDKVFKELETKLRKELTKRDESIIQGRKEYLTMRKEMQEEIERLKKLNEDSLAEMELNYEKRLAQEGLYMEKMKQAYDEYVVHAKMDMIQLNQKTEMRIHEIEAEKSKLINEIDKQKSVVLKYYDYIQDRNAEVLQSLEEQQADERTKLKSQLNQTTTKLLEAQAQNMTSEVQASRTIQRLRVDIENKEMEIMRVNSDIDWANDRITKLEQALQQATTELKVRSELVEKSEHKIGEYSQKVDDLERIRKTLTIQVHLLQSQLDPKEKELSKVKERMQEIAREYDISLHAITEKETVLNQKSENLSLLQKQVRELRSLLAHKDGTLRRAATFFDEFIYSMHEAKFNAKKKNFLPVMSSKDIRNGLGGNGNSNNNNNNNPETSEEKGIGSNNNSNNNLLGTNNNNSSSNNNNNNNNNNTNGDNLDHKDSKKKLGAHTIEALSAPKTHDLVSTLQLDNVASVKLQRLNEILKPYLTDNKVDADIIDDIEAVRAEQERQVQLLHRNFSNLQASLDSKNQAATAKVYNHLIDNQTLLKEVNQLRIEVKALSAENDRLSAQLDFMNTNRRQSKLLPPSATSSLGGGVGGGGGGGPAPPTRNSSFRQILAATDHHAQLHDTLDKATSIQNSLNQYLSDSQANYQAEPVANVNPLIGNVSTNPLTASNLFPPFPNRHEQPPILLHGSSRESKRPTHIVEEQRQSTNNNKKNQTSSSHGNQSASNFRQLASSQILQPTGSVHSLDQHSSQVSALSRSMDSPLREKSAYSAGSKENIVKAKTAEEKIAELLSQNLQEIKSSSTQPILPSAATKETVSVHSKDSKKSRTSSKK